MPPLPQNEFEDLVEQAIARIKEPYKSGLKNIAFLVEDEPSEAQRKQLGLHCNQTLFGLYEGVPLPQRGGSTKLLPDLISIFKGPLERASTSSHELADQVGRTVWHEVAHYYGLNHDRIHALERKERENKKSV